MRITDLLFDLETSTGGDGGGSGGGGDGGSGSGSSTATPPAGESGAQGGDGKQDMVPRSEAQEARREAQNLRERLKTAEKERDDLKSAQMSDSEKLTKERDDLKTEKTTLEEENRNLRVQVISARVGIQDPEAAAALLKWDTIKDSSDEKEIESALKQLVKDKPYLAGNVAGGGDGGAGDGVGTSTTDMNSLLRGATGRR